MVIIGGGLVGVEMARIMVKRNLKVTVIQSKPYLLERYFASNIAEPVAKQFSKESINF